ncbi:hypothetical protein DVH24_002094 [Malus domestica]|uniref:Uncharacterized protein n=1 Tax=Malus domestica TaxID=3750 RepID=A0A498I503_MALDO|nr:hypothetical protein DVH24_002094 [Malus domestica]
MARQVPMMVLGQPEGCRASRLATTRSGEESLSLGKVDSTVKEASKPAPSTAAMSMMLTKNEGTARV